jgi:hypothetical protein
MFFLWIGPAYAFPQKLSQLSHFLLGAHRLPSTAMIAGALNGRDLESLFHPTGEFAARFTHFIMWSISARLMR